jgi:hypothetical protein
MLARMPSLAPRALAAALMLTGAALHAQEPPASPFGTVVGTVRADEGRLLAGAEVRVVGTQLAARTDSAGNFHIEQVPPGLVVLRARALGYHMALVTVTVTADELTDGSVLLASNRPLDTIRVVARSPYDKPARLDYTTRYDEFYARRRTGLGQFLTREEIEKFRGVSTARDLLRRIPFGEKTKRCLRLGLVVDGLRASMDLIDELSSDDIESVELYRSPSSGAMGAKPCSLYLWTR